MIDIAGRIDLETLVQKLYLLYKANTPKRLLEQVRGVCGAPLSSVITLTCVKLEDAGVLERPKDAYFTDQIMLVR